MDFTKIEDSQNGIMPKENNKGWNSRWFEFFLSLMFCLCYLKAYLGYGIFEMDLGNYTSNLSKVLTKYFLS